MELTTDRLVLRTWTLAEAASVLGDSRAADWAEDFPAEGDRVIAGLLDRKPAWLGEHGHRLVIERDRGLVVGAIGLFWPPSDGTLEIGYGIVASRRGRGYATEAARALIDHAFGNREHQMLVAGARISNPASRRVLEKCGFQWTGVGLYRIRAIHSSAPLDRFRLERGIWASLKSWGAARAKPPAPRRMG